MGFSMLTEWKYTFKNLGPVKEATIELGDLTIITGRNNTGKTYLVYTLYGFLRDFKKLAYEIMDDWSSSGRFSNAIDSTVEIIANQLLENESFELRISKDDLDNERVQLIRQMSYLYSHTRIDSVFNALAGTFSSTVFDVEMDQRTREYHPLSYEIWPGIELSILFSRDRISFFLNRSNKLDSDMEPNVLLQPHLLEHDLKLIYAHFLLQKDIFPAVKPHCLTSARFAISLFHAELESSRRLAIRRLQQEAEIIQDEDGSRWVSADALHEASRYALPINDEISFIKEIPNSSLTPKKHEARSPFRDIEEMMGGQFTKIDDVLYFVSSQENQHQFRIPLHLASSSAVEMSNPYFCFAYGGMSSNRLLIIDEPESHLDPINQMKFARALVRWVKTGVRILVSTHSDYIVKEINNLIMLSRPFKNKTQLLKDLNYSKADEIQPTAVKAYYASDGGLQPCSMNEFGIEVPSFEQSIDELIRVSETLGSRIIMESDDDE